MRDEPCEKSLARYGDEMISKPVKKRREKGTHASTIFHLTPFRYCSARLHNDAVDLLKKREPTRGHSRAMCEAYVARSIQDVSFGFSRPLAVTLTEG